MKILITGVAGFIGYSLASNFLENKHTIFGIDNFERYLYVLLFCGSVEKAAFE